MLGSIHTTTTAANSKESTSSFNHQTTLPPLYFSIPSFSYITIDYPGYVVNKDKVIQTLGGLTKIAECYEEILLNIENNKAKPIELRLRPENLFAHPLFGYFVSTCNLLVQIKRRRRRQQQQQPDEKKNAIAPWHYFIEVKGIIHHTCRFRGLADFQWIPEPNDPITQLRSAMSSLDLAQLLSFEVDSEDTNLNRIRSFPPPIFSTIDFPKIYDFKQTHTSSKVQVTNPDGSISYRLHNPFTRSKAPPICSITYTDPIPSHPPNWNPPTHVRALQLVVARLFQERPIWTKLALWNALPLKHQKRATFRLRQVLPLVAYFMTNGPWKLTWIQLGLDPKSNPKFCIYQSLDTRNYYKHHPHHHHHSTFSTSSMVPNSSSTASTSSSIYGGSGKKNKFVTQGHIFDGMRLNEVTSVFQFCDLTDPVLSELVNTKQYLREVCHPLDGWYLHGLLIQLRARFRSRRKSLLTGTPYLPPPQDTIAIDHMKDDVEEEEGIDSSVSMKLDTPFKSIARSPTSTSSSSLPCFVPSSSSLLDPNTMNPMSEEPTHDVQAKVNEIMRQLSQVDEVWQTDGMNQGEEFNFYDLEETNEHDFFYDDDDENDDDDDDEEEEEESDD